MREYEFEPIRGLPEPLPAGERILWQGAPEWWGLAKRAFHARKVAVYCILLLAWHCATAIADGEGATSAALATLGLVPFALVAVGLPVGLAWPFARSTVYTITNRRVVMRFGVAMPMTVNLPFRTIASAALKVDRKGVGDLPLTLAGGDRIAWLVLWPHVRPWRLRQPEPMLRAIPEAAEVAEILADALTRAPTTRTAPVASPADPGNSGSLASAA